jgi:membrane protein implicated in regulation of membrane protease activity
MDAWVWWALAALLLTGAELLSLNLIFLMLAGGAVGGAVAALAGVAPPLELLTFVVVSMLLVGVVRPVALRHLKSGPALRSGVAALIGSEGVVLEAVSGKDGRVKLGGEVWSAKSYDETTELSVGTQVYVIEIKGATALVAER